MKKNDPRVNASREERTFKVKKSWDSKLGLA